MDKMMESYSRKGNARELTRQLTQQNSNVTTLLKQVTDLTRTIGRESGSARHTNMNLKSLSRSAPKQNSSRRRRTKRAAKTPHPHDAYAQMIADPCNSTLVPGLYGSSEGMLARLKSTHALKTSGDHTCGYVLWCPEFSNPGSEVSSIQADLANLFVWQDTDPSSRPLNTISNQFGRGDYTGITADSIPDPVSALMGSNIVADARSLGACIQMTYVGKMLDSAGEVAAISNLPMSELITGGPNGDPLTVNELMVYATTKQRLGVETREVKHKPSVTTGGIFRGEDDGMVQMDWPVTTPASLTSEAETTSPVVFGFVWRSVAPNSPITLDFTKSIEWRPDATSGLTQVPTKHYGASPLPNVLKSLDHAHARGHPVWDNIKRAGAAALGLGANALAQKGMAALGGELESILTVGSKVLPLMAL